MNAFKETIGTQHYILGIVEVTKKEPDMVIAKVLKSFRTIQVGDHADAVQSPAFKN
jgi:hypothetical protein